MLPSLLPPLESAGAVVDVSSGPTVVMPLVIGSVVAGAVVAGIVVLPVVPSVPDPLPEPPSPVAPSSPHAIARRPRLKIQDIRCFMAAG